MSKLVLLITLVLEILLMLTRFIAVQLKKRDPYGSETNGIGSKWEMVPFVWCKLDWYLPSSSDDKKRLNPPKFKKPRSRRV